MEGVGCFAMVFGIMLLMAMVVFVALGMPLVGIVVGLILWRTDRAAGGVVTLISVIAVAAGMPRLMGEEPWFENDLSLGFAVVMQWGLVAVLLIYATFSSTRHEEPQTQTYLLVKCVGWFGLVLNLIAFGVPLIFAV